MDPDRFSNFSDDLMESLNSAENVDVTNTQVIGLVVPPIPITIRKSPAAMPLNSLLDDDGFIYRRRFRGTNIQYYCENPNCTSKLISLQIEHNKIEWIREGEHHLECKGVNDKIYCIGIPGSIVHVFPNMDNPRVIIREGRDYIFERVQYARNQSKYLKFKCKNCECHILCYNIKDPDDLKRPLTLFETPFQRNPNNLQFEEIPHSCKRIKDIEVFKKKFRHIQLTEPLVKPVPSTAIFTRPPPEKIDPYNLSIDNMITTDIPSQVILQPEFCRRIHDFAKDPERNVGITVMRSPKVSDLESEHFEHDEEETTELPKNSSKAFVKQLREHYKLDKDVPVLQQMHKILPELLELAAKFPDAKMMAYHKKKSSKLKGFEYDLWTDLDDKGNQILLFRLKESNQNKRKWKFCSPLCDKIIEFREDGCWTHSTYREYVLSYLKFKIQKSKQDEHEGKVCHYVRGRFKTSQNESKRHIGIGDLKYISQVLNITVATLKQSHEKTVSTVWEKPFKEDEYNSYVKKSINLRLAVFFMCQFVCKDNEKWKQNFFIGRQLFNTHLFVPDEVQQFLKKLNIRLYLFEENPYIYKKSLELAQRRLPEDYDPSKPVVPSEDDISSAKRTWGIHKRLVEIDYHNLDKYKEEVQQKLVDIQLCWGNCRNPSQHVIYLVEIKRLDTNEIRKYIGYNENYRPGGRPSARCHHNIENDNTALGLYLSELRLKGIPYVITQERILAHPKSKENGLKLEAMFQFAELLVEIVHPNVLVQILNRQIQADDWSVTDLKIFQSILLKEHHVMFEYVCENPEHEEAERIKTKPRAYRTQLKRKFSFFEDCRKQQNAEPQKKMKPDEPMKSTEQKITKPGTSLSKFPAIAQGAGLYADIFDIQNLQIPRHYDIGTELNNRDIMAILELCNRTDDDQSIGEYNGQELRLREFKQLYCGDLFTPDEVLFAYFYIVINSEPMSRLHPNRKVYCCPPAFALNLIEKKSPEEYYEMERLIRSIGLGEEFLIFNYDMVFFPLVQTGDHITLVVVWPKLRKIRGYDSLFRSTTQQQIRDTFDYIQFQYLELHASNYKYDDIIGWDSDSFMDHTEWDIKQLNRNEIPEQQMSNDCGIFICANFLILMQLGAEVQKGIFDQRHANYFRLRIGSELLNNELIWDDI